MYPKDRRDAIGLFLFYPRPAAHIVGQGVRTSMTEWEKAIAVLPPEVVRVLETVPPAVKEQAQEIRFRKNCPLTLSLPEKDYQICGFYCTGNTLYNIFLHLCEYSVHSHQEELRQGPQAFHQ